MEEETSLTVRVDADVAQNAQKILAPKGLTLNAAIALFLAQIVAEQGLPFTPSLLSPLDQATMRAEADIAAGRMTTFETFADLQATLKKLN